jgi:hypothetical protein
VSVAAIHIHEDDWGMRCLHPLAAAAEVADDVRAARLAALRQAIVAIDQLVPSVIAYYWLDRTGPVRDSAFLDDYMRRLGRSG